jgi:ribulose bisphosphate carboxylase small subunit
MQEGTNLPPLTDDEVRNALRYGAFEINGYPKWFWPLVQAYEAVAGQELLRMVQCAKAGPISMDHAEQLLTSLDEAPPSVQEKLAPLAWTFLQEHPGLRAHVVEKLLKAVILSTRAASRAKFEAIAWNKVAAAFDGQLPKDQEQASNVHDLRKRSVIWASSWLARYPSTFQRKLEGWFKRFPDEARAFIYELAAHLGEDHGAPLVRVAQASDDGMSMLGALYRWTLEAVRPEEDKVHSDGEVYAVGSRENAERLRDSLIPSIAAAKSERAYQVLEELRRSATGYRARYLRAVQFDMREEQAARPAVAQQRYGDFERSLTADVTDTTSFAMAVHSDLLAVKYDIERGEFSLRRFFSEMNVRRVRTDKDGWALEAEFQGLLASELNHHSRGRYSVTIESRTAEAKRRDVLCSKGDNFASIELKMSERWTLQDYVQALEKQLVGQYMRHRKATTGFLVVVLQRSKQWKDPDTRRKVGFDGLLAILRSKALQLEARDRRRYLRIVGIDATPPVNFRHVAKTVRRKATKKSAVRGNAASATKGVATKNARGAAGAAARRRSTTEEPAVRRTSSAKKRAVTVVSRRKAATHKRPAAAK